MRLVRFAPAFGDADRVIHAFGRRSLKTPMSLEMIHLPYVLFRYGVDWTTLGGSPRTTEGIFSADLAQGVPMNVGRRTRIDVPEELRGEFAAVLPLLVPEKSRARVALERVEVRDEAVLPAILDDDEAIARSRDVFKYDLMRLMGGLRFRKIAISPRPDRRRVYYPYWLVYHKDRRGRTGFQTIDGITGEREHGAVVRSIQLALLKKAGKWEPSMKDRERNRP